MQAMRCTYSIGSPMFRITSQRPDAPCAPPPIHPVEPLASFDVLARTLRRALQDHHLPLRRSAAAAIVARRAGACDALVTAALLHRVGDLVAPWPEGPARRSDAALAHRGADLLLDLYAPMVTESIRLQPSARRYLVKSSRSASQPMAEPERACFARLPFAMNSVKVARWILAVDEDPAVDAAFERELPALCRIAERSVCNGGAGWSG